MKSVKYGVFISDDDDSDTSGTSDGGGSSTDHGVNIESTTGKYLHEHLSLKEAQRPGSNL